MQCYASIDLSFALSYRLDQLLFILLRYWLWGQIQAWLFSEPQPPLPTPICKMSMLLSTLKIRSRITWKKKTCPGWKISQMPQKAISYSPCDFSVCFKTVPRLQGCSYKCGYEYVWRRLLDIYSAIVSAKNKLSFASSSAHFFTSGFFFGQRIWYLLWGKR